LTDAFASFIERCIRSIYCVNVILIRNVLGSVVKLLMLPLHIQDRSSHHVTWNCACYFAPAAYRLIESKRNTRKGMGELKNA